VNLKGDAFTELFKAYGDVLVNKIRTHHALHGGVSRFDKIPLYLGWAGLPQDPENVRRFCERFSHIVFQKVLEAPWVPGAEKLLRYNPFQQRFFLVTATPQPEIESILGALNLAVVFEGVFGAPVKKTDAIQKVLAASGIASARCLLVGDSLADQQAALAANIPFLLREHSDNRDLPWMRSVPCISDFLGL
jgi:phosphoglycolate phosphatase-like HAD superfamily hydrolase